jgi:endoglucanase
MAGVRPAAVMLVCAVALVAAGATQAPAQTTGTAAQSAGNPLTGLRFFVDRSSPSWHQWRVYRHRGKRRKEALIWRIAREPKALWLGRFTSPHFRKKVRRLVVAAKRQGTVPIFTVIRAVSDRCSPGYTAGGPAEDARTRSWYRRLGRTLGHSRIVLLFEPDSLGTIDCHARSRRDDRLRLLRYGVKVLSRNPNATIYLEGGASDWEPARRTARQLRAIGIARVRGFMLNATHQDWTRANIRHGLKISRMTGGKHFVINTAENGRGPVHYRLANGRRITVWCNPGLRGLGPPPTMATSNPMVDAYLWINRPGYAQRCQGRKIAWFAPRALAYARHATRWESPPRGTRFGYRKRYPFSVFAGSR